MTNKTTNYGVREINVGRTFLLNLDFQQLTLSRLEELSQQVADIKRLVQTISTSQTEIGPRNLAVFDLFPMQNEDDFHKLETEIRENPSSYQALVTKTRLSCFK